MRLDIEFQLQKFSGKRRVRSDFDLDPDKKHIARTALKPAAVLVPLVDYGTHYSILLTKRAGHLKKHAGQISFPGGRVEKQDTCLLQTALRETYEEIGLPKDYITVMGKLDPYVTVTEYEVSPYVGLVKPGFSYRPDHNEVDEVFEIPLDFILDTEKHKIEEVMFKGKLRRYYAMPYKGYYIWGATAAMLVNLAEILNS